MMKNQIIIIIVITVITIIFTKAVSAQTPCGSGTFQATGLVSSPLISGQFPTSGACIINPKVSFAPFKIPSYGDLKSKFFDQVANQTKKVFLTSSILTSADLQTQKTHFYDSTINPLSVSSALSYTGVYLVFVNGDLNISSNIIGSAQASLVLVISGNINIDPAVTQVDATLVSSGTIYTAGSGCGTNSVQTTNKLTINGSLISLNQSAPDQKPIHFCRTLADNSSATESINQQPKYLSTLRFIFAQPLQRWREIAGDENIVFTSPAPAPAPSPSPSPPAGFNFSLAASCSPTDTNCSLGNINVTAGQSGSNTITAIRTSGSQTVPVSFTASGLPTGVTSSFSPLSCSPTCSPQPTLTISTTPAPVTNSSILFRGSATNVATTNQNSITVSKPTGVVEGDVMVAQITVSSSAGSIPPSGWSLIRNLVASFSHSTATYYKVAGASEPVSYTWTIGCGCWETAAIIAYSGVDIASPIDAENGQLGSSTPPVTTTVPGDMIVTFFSANNGGTWTPPLGMTERYDIRIPFGFASAEGADAYQLNAGETGSKTATDSTASTASIIALKPASNTPTPVTNTYPITVTGTAIGGIIKTILFSLTITQ